MMAGTSEGGATAGTEGMAAEPRPPGFDLAAVVGEYETPLLRYVGRLLGWRYDEAQDVVQEVFMKLHRQVGRQGLAGIGNLRCWLYRVAHNLAMDYGRARRRRQELEQKALSDPAVLERLQGRAPGAGVEEVARTEASQRALAAVAGLPEEQRSVVLLKLIQGLTLREISEATGMKIGTVNYRLTQGLRGLAAQLKMEGVR